MLFRRRFTSEARVASMRTWVGMPTKTKLGTAVAELMLLTAKRVLGAKTKHKITKKIAQ
jgi:hypothetical protein